MRSPEFLDLAYRTMEQRVKGIMRSSRVALFLLVMSSLANSVPLTQLSRATGKYLTIQVHRGPGPEGMGEQIRAAGMISMSN